MKFFLRTVVLWLGAQILIWVAHYHVWVRYFPQHFSTAESSDFWLTVLVYIFWPLWLIIIWQLQWRKRKNEEQTAE